MLQKQLDELREKEKKAKEELDKNKLKISKFNKEEEEVKGGSSSDDDPDNQGGKIKKKKIPESHITKIRKKSDDD